jgi:3-phosphoshikimate 1-carboxyvinyltransferase
MGGSIEEVDPREVGGEPVADLRVRHSLLHGIDVDPAVVPSMVDEFPVLFVAACLAQGRTVCTGWRNCASRNRTASPSCAGAGTGGRDAA